MAVEDLREAAERFRAAHRPGDPVVLPVVWDVASARSAARAGFPFVGTGSSGIAAAHGFPDGEHIGVDGMFRAVTAITRCLNIPVSVDMESGYGLRPDLLAHRLLAAGVVGCNLEDSDPTRPGDLVGLAARTGVIAGLRRAFDRAGIPLVINARTDAYQHASLDPVQRSRDGVFARAVRRARAYLDAGADCVFPMGLRDPDEAARFVRAVDGPVNVLVGRDGLPDMATARDAGAARISFGAQLMEAAYRHLEGVLADIAGFTYPVPRAVDVVPASRQPTGAMAPGAPANPLAAKPG